jgi:hypothetical protein
MSIFYQYSKYINNQDLDNLVLKHLELSDLVNVFLINKYYYKLLKSTISKSFEHIVETLPENSLWFVWKKFTNDDWRQQEGSDYFFFIPKYIIKSRCYSDELDNPKTNYIMYGSKIYQDGEIDHLLRFDFSSCGKCSLINGCKNQYDPKYCLDRSSWIHNYICEKCKHHVDDKLCSVNPCNICDRFNDDHNCEDYCSCSDDWDDHLEICPKYCGGNYDDVYFYGDADDGNHLEDATLVSILVLRRGISNNKVPIFTWFKSEDVENIIKNDIKIWDDYMDQGFGPTQHKWTTDDFMYDGEMRNTVFTGDSMYVLRSDLYNLLKKDLSKVFDQSKKIK